MTTVEFDLKRFGAFEDPKAQAKEFIKATKKVLDNVQLMRNRVVVGTFVRPGKIGTIILPDRMRDEDRFQGKAGVVLALGPSAFHFAEDPMPSEIPKIGDWVFYRPAETSEICIGEGAPCRMLYDDVVVGILKDPRLIW